MDIRPFSKIVTIPIFTIFDKGGPIVSQIFSDEPIFIVRHCYFQKVPAFILKKDLIGIYMLPVVCPSAK